MRFVPAELSFSDGQTIEQLITFPDTESDVTVVLPCALWTRSRRTPRSVCFRRDNSIAAFEEALQPALQNLRATAARIDGRLWRYVWVPFSVEFIRRGDDERVRVYPNYGAEEAKYGKEYIGPQRAIRTSARSVFRNCGIGRITDIVWASATITADGRAEDIRVEPETTDQCRERIEALFLRSSFVPAHFQGNPVSAEFLEPFF